MAEGPVPLAVRLDDDARARALPCLSMDDDGTLRRGHFNGVAGLEP